ncbi:MAG TPA: S-adenosylmethionine:tRNA ribosyltransferase-isomerase, partial [Flavisolibacter sp.]|nr:S-adenosylmethionine:tRNA ribosyltransferase-isomerase [Flavisolibacter sp.]
AVGTTSLRTMESIYWLGVKLIEGLLGEAWTLEQWEMYDLDDSINYKESLQAIVRWMQENKREQLHCRTSMIIVPGYRFNIPSGIITNFHQPQSTLLLLIAAFIGEDWRKIYQHALENDYRFLSYGDSSLLWRD